MKIILMITGLGIGGAERQVVDLADSFDAMGHSVMIIGLTGSAAFRPVSDRIRIEMLGMRRSPVDFLRSYCRARELIRDFAPDVVHSHMVHANLMARLLRLTATFPRLVCTAHNTNEGGFLRMLAYRLTDPLADVSTNVSQEAVDIFRRLHAVPAGKMFAMPNGIDTVRFRFDAAARQRIRTATGSSEETTVLLSVGRLVEAKDYPNLLRAFARVSLSPGKCVLWIVGSGPLENTLRDLATSLGIAGHVHFWGLSADVPSVMSAADILVLSSAWEGFGLVVAEAMACERLVVATDAGGVRAVVGDTGWLVPIRHSTRLADAISSAMALNASERALRGAAGRHHVEQHFSLNAVAARWVRIYQGNYAG